MEGLRARTCAPTPCLESDSAGNILELAFIRAGDRVDAHPGTQHMHSPAPHILRAL
ncbi:hypothetical protein TRAPUB_2125 [Trametes pubescens]|uniref:Uncharacterized protein n=1 Tax=Trametes pubescens TaxID=154538 RepID=A0A1M2VHF7_TRAPU|nr:hypothetical protein TRAPUB_2125 [Trametes pubescens]